MKIMKMKVFQKLVKLFMIILFGENIRKDITEEYKCKSEFRMSAECNERVLDNWKLPNGEYVVKLKQDDGSECETDLRNTMPARLGKFILSTSKRTMNKFISKNNGFKTKNNYYTDTDTP